MASSKNKKDKKPKSRKMKGNILEEIKDVYYKDLPESLQKDLMEIHKIIVQGCHDEWQKSYYDDIRNSAWAKSMYDEFCEMPMGKQNTGSARLYKKKNRYSCMIQITGHVPNNREDIQHEEFHEFIRAVHINLKAKIRRKFDMALVCESEHGEHFEGFDVWPKQKVAKMLWEKYPDVRIIEDKPHKDKEVTESTHTYSMDVECLPYGLQEKVFAYNEFIRHNIVANASDELLNEDGFVEFMYSTDLTDDDIGYTEVTESIESNGKIYLTGPLYLKGVKEYKEEVTELIKDTCNQLNYLMDDSTKKIIFENNQFVLVLDPEYANKIVEYSMVESTEPILEKKTKLDYSIEKFKKKYNYDPKTSTILIDGKRVKVDMGNSLVAKIGDQYLPRQMMAATRGDEPIIILNDGYFKIGNQKMRDALLAHEFGHLKMHRIGSDDSNIVNPNFINKNTVRMVIQPIIDQFKAAELNNVYIKALVDATMDDPEVKQYLGKKVDNKEFNKLRTRALAVANKYVKGTTNPHWNLMEVEADRYAANKTSESDLRKGLNKLYKQSSGDASVDRALRAQHKLGYLPFGYTDEDRKLAKRLTVAANEDERKRRYAALKDPELRKAEIYKPESTDDEYFYKEDVNDTEETNPKATIASLADMVMKNEKNISQASASTFATVITANFLKDWAPGYNKFNLYVGNYKKGNELEFKLPTMNKEFISRFIQGRESIDGFLHQNPEITVKMDSRVFTTMKNKTDAYRFFKSLIKYYANAIPKFANKLQSAVSTMNRKTKFVISNSTLNGLIAIPFRMLTAFDNVDMSAKNYFHLKNSEVDTVCKFILNVAENYNDKTDKKENIIKDLKGVISSFNESTSYDQNLVSIRRSIDTYINGVDSVVMEEWNDHNAIWMDEQVDINETYHNEDGEIAYLQEAHKVKKLKKIPRDLIAYITIETESIEDANDKMMIASYCLGKLDIVEWYIELIDTANPKYIVPHTRPYLVTLRTQLLECYKNIMATKIPDKKKRPYLDIDYPAGFEG